MTRSLFNDDWTVEPNVSIFTELTGGTAPARVVLPHDSTLALARRPEATSGKQSGYIPGGAVRYRKTFEVPLSWSGKRVALEFQGVYRDAMVFVNDAYVTQRPSGYATFRAEIGQFLRFGAPNAIRVEARSHLDSRWYAGLGIHRDVVLIVSERAHISDDGVRATTVSLEDDLAVVQIATRVDNADPSSVTLRLQTRLINPEGREIASQTVPVTVLGADSVIARQRFAVADPLPWSADTPALYRLEVALLRGDEFIDAAHESFGIRTLQLDPVRGFRVNGHQVKLRGACIHSDNGILGAAAWPRADERRVAILKDAGFNAIRAAHNPISDGMLEACDRLGMYVIDEAFDMWADGKNPFDYSLAFPEWWERDLASMVAKDFNHPCVVMYSIGNEVLEAGSPFGAHRGRQLAEKVRSLDGTRFVTNGISGFVGTIYETLHDLRDRARALQAGGINDIMSELHAFMDEISLSDRVARLTEESHASVDVVGLNYAHERYLGDAPTYPDRVVVGTETLPKDIAAIWRLVQDHAHVVGDFTWTGWDYLGEAGLGRTVYEDAAGNMPSVDAFPALLAWCGDIDITGKRRPASYFREIVFGLRHEPYAAVFRPESGGRLSHALNWAWADTIESWTFDIEPQTPVEVEVYSTSDEVDLLLNGSKVATVSTGASNGYRGRATIPYRAGELVAVARTGGIVGERHALRSVKGPVHVAVEADRGEVRGDGRDLSFITIELRDSAGTVDTAHERSVTVEVEGPGELLGLGSANPVTSESFSDDEHRTFEGRALAIVRPTAVGLIIVRVNIHGGPSEQVTILAI